MVSRAMPIAKLVKILNQFPAGSTVETNSIGNLIVSDPDDEMLGYIDLATEKFESVDE